MFLDGATDGSGCDYFEQLACNLPPGAPTEGCALYLELCAQICGQSIAYPCSVVECGDAGVIPSGPITVICDTGKLGCADGGRRPEGLVEGVAEGAAARTAMGEWLAHLAWLEAASVHAFRKLGEELESMKAPRRLVRGAKRAAKDEVRHARVVARLARKHGGKPARVRVAGTAPRSRAAFARENAVEGCVREAFGALVATWLARHARAGRGRSRRRWR